MKYVATMLSAALVLGLAGMSTPALADGKSYGLAAATTTATATSARLRGRTTTARK